MDILELKTGLYPQDDLLDNIAEVTEDLEKASDEADWDRVIEAILDARLVLCT